MLANWRTLIFASGLAFLITAAGCTTKGTDPSAGVDQTALAGTWIANYGAGASDKLELMSNGLFRQQYEEPQRGYQFETGWRTWRLVRVDDGTLQVHLEGARYFLDGIERAEADGLINPKNPCLTPTDCDWGLRPFAFYNPFSRQLVHMVGELLLVVRADARGELILHHIWTSSDGGFPIIGGEAEVFRRTDGQ